MIFSIGIFTEHSQGSVETLFRRGGKHYNYVVTHILRDMNTNNYENWSTFDLAIMKN